MKKQLTPRAIKFLEKNKKTRITRGEWCNANGRPAEGHPSTWTKFKMRFDDYTVMTLSRADMDSIPLRSMKWVRAKASKKNTPYWVIGSREKAV